MFQCKSTQNIVSCIVSNGFAIALARRNLWKISGKQWCSERREKTSSASNHPAQSTNLETNKENYICDNHETLVTLDNGWDLVMVFAIVWYIQENTKPMKRICRSFNVKIAQKQGRRGAPGHFPVGPKRL